jgi:UDP-3-O-[3-hydroxymyristoyl] glucosamine N-acyltransferase
MRFPAPVPATWLAEFTGAQLLGDQESAATGINEIHKVEPGDIVFVDHPKYYQKCIHSAAKFIIINQAVDFPPEKVLLVTPQPFDAYQKLTRHFRPFEPQREAISATAVIGEGTQVFPGAFIGHHTRIGKNCIIHPSVTIYDHCVIGDDVVIHAGSVIGSHAFYYNTKKDRELWYKKMHSCGRVVIGDEVEIGAGCTIDKGVSGDTVIGSGTKLDNMCHIGHDTIIGKNCLMAAQVAIAGATTIEDGVTLWGQVGVSKTLTIGKNAVVLAQSGVGVDIQPGKIFFGSPAEDAMLKKKELVWIRRIPELWEKVMK